MNIDDRGNFHPVYVPVTAAGRIPLISAIQAGARSFADDVCRTLGPHAAKAPFTPDVAASVMENFLARPSQVDAQLFAGQEIEDTFSGAQKRYFLYPTKSNSAVSSSYWKTGAAALSPENAMPTGDKAKRTKISKAHIGDGPVPFVVSGKKVPIVRRPLVPIVRVFVRRLGNREDVARFNADPAMFFASLGNRRHRRIGAILFPSPSS